MSAVIVASPVRRICLLAGTWTLLLAGCAGPQSALEIHGPAAQRIAEIWWAMLATGAIIYLVVAALVLYLFFRRQSGGSRAGGVNSAGSDADSAPTRDSRTNG